MATWNEVPLVKSAETDAADDTNLVTVNADGKDYAKLELLHSSNNWLQIKTTANGATSVNTYNGAFGTSADLLIQARGDITLQPNAPGKNVELSGTYVILDATQPIIIDSADMHGTGFYFDQGTNANPYAKISNNLNGGMLQLFTNDSTTDCLELKTIASGRSYIKTTHNAGADADLDIDVDGEINIDSAAGVVNFKNNGTSIGRYINPVVASMVFGR